MKERPPLPQGPYLVVGLARSGIAAALALRALGHEVIAIDSGAPEPAGERLSQAGVEVHLDVSGEAHAARARSLVKSPGVPRSAPAVRAALERGLPVLGELELAWRLLPNEFIAVTGTNGKTTTTEWIGHVHREAGLPVRTAGNVGTALSSLVGTLSPDTVVVAEASSFQLEDTLAFAPEAAVLLNVTADHLDRHGTFEAYREAKLRVFAHQGNDDLAVAPEGLGVEDLGGCARRVCFGESPGAELASRAGHLWWDERPLIAHEVISLPGMHNRQNAMATAAVCLARGVPAEAVVRGLSGFPGVPHRLEAIATRHGVVYVNDSKATNVASTIVALRSYAGGVHLIAGGRGKAQDFTPLAEEVARCCRAVYLIGEAAEEIADALPTAGVPLIRSGGLEQALARAAADARPGEVVLLSPACASFDSYRDFEERGEHFRGLVEALA